MQRNNWIFVQKLHTVNNIILRVVNRWSKIAIIAMISGQWRSSSKLISPSMSVSGIVISSPKYRRYSAAAAAHAQPVSAAVARSSSAFAAITTVVAISDNNAAELILIATRRVMLASSWLLQLSALHDAVGHDKQSMLQRAVQLSAHRDHQTP